MTLLFFTVSFGFTDTDIGDGQLLIIPQGEIIATAGGASSSIGMSGALLNPAYLSNLSYKFTLNTGIFNGIFSETDEVMYLNLAMKPFPKMYLYLGYVSFGSEEFTTATFDGTIIEPNFQLSNNSILKIGLPALHLD